MFERFTDRARRVTVLANEEAELLGHSYVGTEHLLLGMISEGECVAGVVLKEAGVTMAAAREEVRSVSPRIFPPYVGARSFTPRAKKVIELALRSALNLGQSYIGTEHLLLGLIREREGKGAIVLSRVATVEGAPDHLTVMDSLYSAVVDRIQAYQNQRTPEPEPEPANGAVVTAVYEALKAADLGHSVRSVATVNRGARRFLDALALAGYVVTRAEDENPPGQEPSPPASPPGQELTALAGRLADEAVRLFDHARRILSGEVEVEAKGEDGSPGCLSVEVYQAGSVRKMVANWYPPSPVPSDRPTNA